MFFEAREDALDVQVLRPQALAQLARGDGRRHRRLGECPHGIRRREGTSGSVLVSVDQHRAWRALFDGALLGHELRMFGGYQPSDDIRKGPQLLVRVAALDRQVHVQSGGPGSLEVDGQTELL